MAGESRSVVLRHGHRQREPDNGLDRCGDSPGAPVAAISITLAVFAAVFEPLIDAAIDQGLCHSDIE